jgi:hypothetical protein
MDYFPILSTGLAVILLTISLTESFKLNKFKQKITATASRQKIFIILILNILFVISVILILLGLLLGTEYLSLNIIFTVLPVGAFFVLLVNRTLRIIFKQVIIHSAANEKTTTILHESRYKSLEAMELYSALAQVAAFLANEINNPLFNLGIDTDRNNELSLRILDSFQALLLENPALKERYPELKNEIEDMKKTFLSAYERVQGNRNRIAESVKEIRGITGVDGFAIGSVNIAELVRSVLEEENIKNIISQKSFSFFLDIPKADEICQCYRLIIRRAVQLLLKSACHYALKSPKPFVQLTLTSESDSLKLLFKNNGPPIPTKRAEELFKLNKTPQAGGHAEHLGIALINKLLYPQGSILKLEQNDKQGVNFSLAIPRKMNSKTFKDMESIHAAGLK